MSQSILMITSEFGKEIVGGLGIVASKLTSQLRRNGYQVTVITLNRKGHELKKEGYKNITVYHFPKQPPYYQCRQLVAQEILPYIELPDLIHLQSVQGLELAKALKNQYGIPVVYTSHSMGIVESETTDRERTEVNLQQEKIYELADTIICPSRMEKHRFGLHYPYLQNKVEVIPNGIDVHKVEPKKNIHPHRLLYVGRAARSKGLETLILALPKVIQKLPKTVLHVIGHGSSSYMKQINDLIRQYNLKHKVIFHPWMEQAELSRYYKASTIVIIPSYYESFGMVMLEAMAHGTAVIATTEVGAAEEISRSVVLKVPPKDSDQMAKAIIHLLKNRHTLIERGKSGIEISKEYTWDRPVLKYIELYKRLIPNAPDTEENSNPDIEEAHNLDIENTTNIEEAPNSSHE